ncbi:MAG: hypothetical protein N4A40_01870 [Tissierellales bacterium]|jgi:hypothetical protein|nr:hypothetical protein [Tissierellales bacterium]
MRQKNIKEKLHSLSLPKLTTLLILFVLFIGFTFHFIISSSTANMSKNIETYADDENLLLSEVRKIIHDPTISRAVTDRIVVPLDRSFEPKDLDHVLELDLYISESDDVNFEDLLKLKGLYALSISSEKNIDLSDLVLNNLTNLDLHEYSSNKADWKLPNAPNLKSLHIFSDFLSIPSFIETMSNFSTLEELSLSPNNRNSVNYEDLSFLTQFSSLKSLYLFDINVESFDGIEDLKSLNSITFWNGKISNISAFLKSESLNDIYLLHPGTSDENIQTLRNHFGDKISIEIDNE